MCSTYDSREGNWLMTALAIYKISCATLPWLVAGTKRLSVSEKTLCGSNSCQFAWLTSSAYIDNNHQTHKCVNNRTGDPFGIIIVNDRPTPGVDWDGSTEEAAESNVFSMAAATLDMNIIQFTKDNPDFLN
jgi:hypothetical protein